jgi:hypothetical protein
MNRKLLVQELDKVIDANVESFAKVATSACLKEIGRELMSHDLEWDEQYDLPSNTIARLIYLYVRKNVKERMDAGRSK